MSTYEKTGLHAEGVVFSHRELRRRIEKAQELLKDARIDCLFMTGDENFHYFTGGAGMTHMRSNTRPNIVIVPAEGEPIAITGAAFTPIIELAGAIRDIRPYTSILGAPVPLLAKALKDLGLKNRKVGVELGLEQRLNLPLKDYLELAKSLPDIEFLDASEIIWDLRMVKSKEEVALIRQACQITGHARQKTFREVEVGMTEREIMRLFARHLLEAGGDRVSFIIVNTGIPSNSTYIYLDRPLKKGNVLSIDGGTYVHTYTCDYVRLAVAGNPTPDQERNHRVVREVSQQMAEALKPGLTCADIFKVGAKALKEEGFAAHTKTGRMGHGQGILVTEPPSITAHDKTVLKPGMVISTEPSGPKTSRGSFTWEDVYVITDDGAERLSTETEEFFEI
jgi:Xaa-Pro aminopeptidase